MLGNQGRHPRPCGQGEQRLDEASADKCSCAVPLSAPLVASAVDTSDQRRYFGGVEKCCYVADDRATRYLSSCHGSYPSCGHGPGSSRFAGPLFPVFAGTILTGASDGKAPGGARARRAIRPVHPRSVRASTPGSRGDCPTIARPEALLLAPEALGAGGGTRTRNAPTGRPLPKRLCIPVPPHPHPKPPISRRLVYSHRPDMQSEIGRSFNGWKETQSTPRTCSEKCRYAGETERPFPPLSGGLRTFRWTKRPLLAVSARTIPQPSTGLVERARGSEWSRNYRARQYEGRSRNANRKVARTANFPCGDLVFRQTLLDGEGSLEPLDLPLASRPSPVSVDGVRHGRRGVAEVA